MCSLDVSDTLLYVGDYSSTVKVYGERMCDTVYYVSVLVFYRNAVTVFVSVSFPNVVCASKAGGCWVCLGDYSFTAKVFGRWMCGCTQGCVRSTPCKPPSQPCYCLRLIPPFPPSRSPVDLRMWGGAP